MSAMPAIENISQDVGPTWDEYVSLGQQHAHAQKLNRFALGDLAIGVCGLPPRGRPAGTNEDTVLPMYASDIDVPYTTLNDYRRFADFYTLNLREFFDDASYYLMRVAMRAGRRKYPDALQSARGHAMKLLVYAIDNDLGGRGLERHVAEREGKQPGARQATLVDMAAEWGMTIEALLQLPFSVTRKDDTVIMKVRVG